MITSGPINCSYPVPWSACDTEYNAVIETVTRLTSEHMRARIDSLLCKVAAADRELSFSVLKFSSAVLEINHKKWKHYIENLEIIADVNPFVIGYLLEKIPFLLKNSLDDEVISFLFDIRNYTSRHLGYMIGSKDSTVNDIEQVVTLCGVDYFRTLLRSVRERHTRLRAIAAHLLVVMPKYRNKVSSAEIGEFCDEVALIYERYGTEMVVAIFLDADRIETIGSIKKIRTWLEVHGRLGVDYFAVALRLGEILHPEQRHLIISEDLIEVLSANGVQVQASLGLYQNRIKGGLIRFWPELEASAQANFLTQLKCPGSVSAAWDDDVEAKYVRLMIGEAWYEPWSFCESIIDNDYLRSLISNVIATSLQRSETQKLIAAHRTLFDRQTPYTLERIAALSEVVASHIEPSQKALLLHAIATFSSGDRAALRETLSADNIYLDLWDRSPLIDYGRSDEIFACTGIGDYGASNGPLALCDPGLARIRFWLRGNCVGRINLYAVFDEAGIPAILVDGLEGSDRIVQTQSRLKEIMKAICLFAASTRIPRLLLNCEVTFNHTPKKFITLILQQIRLAPERRLLRRSVTSLGPFSSLPHPRLPFLEAFGSNCVALGSVVPIDPSCWLH